MTEGPLSRVELARRTGLSSTAITKSARPLIEDGYLHELPPARTAPGAGRPVNPLAVTVEREFFVGVKISADTLHAVVCDRRSGLRATAGRSLGEDRRPEAVCALICEFVELLLTAEPVFRERTRYLGIAVSGDVDRAAGRVRYSVLPGWQDVPLGIGSGLVVNNRLMAGEVGHISIDPADPRRHCGQVGCVEAIASSDAIVGAVRRATGQDGLDFDGAVLLARGGNAAAWEVFARAGRAIGTGIATLVALFGPERVVVTGEGLDTYDLLGTHIKDAYADHCFKAAANCPLTLRPLPWEEWPEAPLSWASRRSSRRAWRQPRPRPCGRSRHPVTPAPHPAGGRPCQAATDGGHRPGHAPPPGRMRGQWIRGPHHPLPPPSWSDVP
ncbi:ROK family protein [Streptomyces sp. NPDC097617]|uniref:ROK family transcriptional regulator n=1 Tax=Streptomyces sp. NPDC097617 TaxID=3366091 RepID=UPI00382DF4AC